MSEPDPEIEAVTSFEDALTELEAIVDDLERGAPELSAALAKYEQGVKLLARCHGVLDRAERSVALLAGVDGDGNPVTTSFDPETSAANEAATPVRSASPSPPAPKPRGKKRPSGEGDEAFIPF